MNTFKKMLITIIGIVVLSQTELPPGLMVKSICINGYEFIVTYPIKWNMGKPLAGEFVSVVQVYERARTHSGTHLPPQPKQCK